MRERTQYRISSRGYYESPYWLTVSTGVRPEIHDQARQNAPQQVTTQGAQVRLRLRHSKKFPPRHKRTPDTEVKVGHNDRPQNPRV